MSLPLTPQARERAILRQQKPRKPLLARKRPVRHFDKAISRSTDEAPNAVAGRQSSPLARHSSLKPIGKKGREWITAKAWLTRHFRYAGIMSCEARLKGCWGETALSWSHCKKRRNLLEGELYHVALLCVPCHQVYEAMSHDEMYTAIHAIINRRGLISPHLEDVGI